LDQQNPYFRQAALLIKVLPAIGESGCFALKGGTAINLFFRDFPRLSVDIDLVYLPLKARTEALSEIEVELDKISIRIKRLLHDVKIQTIRHGNMGIGTRLLVQHEQAIIKIEISPVLRGTVFQPEIRRICRKAEDIFGFVEIPVVSFADTYAGKIVAGLDRQHPRDLFDINLLLNDEGFTPPLKEAFFVYLISHNRNIIEILSPHRHDIRGLFKTDFIGMSFVPVEIRELEETRELLISIINRGLTDEDKQFLLDFLAGTPNWEYFSVPHIKDLPAVQWKQYNLDKLSQPVRQKMIQELAMFFWFIF
jgi:predicted nucleotidyltransferase component of viral defense system